MSARSYLKFLTLLCCCSFYICGWSSKPSVAIFSNENCWMLLSSGVSSFVSQFWAYSWLIGRLNSRIYFMNCSNRIMGLYFAKEANFFHYFWFFVGILKWCGEGNVSYLTSSINKPIFIVWTASACSRFWAFNFIRYFSRCFHQR